jgi:hypothetical protein
LNFELTNSATAISTSDASPYVKDAVRPLHKAEADLLTALIDMLPQAAELRRQMVGASVQEMHDGGMGSLRFVSRDDSKAHEVIAARSFDDDGTQLEISLNLDQHGDLFELDIWKVDFSPLIRLPEPAQVQRV